MSLSVKLVQKRILIFVRYCLLLSLIGIPVQIVVRKIHWRGLRRKSVAMGLTHIRGENDGDFGILTGHRNGGYISVKIDSGELETHGTRVDIFSHLRADGLELNQDPPVYDQAKDVLYFQTTVPEFEMIFKTRRGGIRALGVLRNHPELMDKIIEFYRKWMVRIHRFTIREKVMFGIPGVLFRVVLNYGHPWEAYVPPRALDRLLDDFSELAAEFRRVYNEQDRMILETDRQNRVNTFETSRISS